MVVVDGGKGDDEDGIDNARMVNDIQGGGSDSDALQE